jgi:hypothetical protein
MRKLRKFRENTAAATSSHEKEEDRKSCENIVAVQMQNLVKT